MNRTLQRESYEARATWLAEQCATPWVVYYQNKQMLAYGPWRLVEISRDFGIDGPLRFRVYRERVRRAAIHKDLPPAGKIWAYTFPPVGWDQTKEGTVNLP